MAGEQTLTITFCNQLDFCDVHGHDMKVTQPYARIHPHYYAEIRKCITCKLIHHRSKYKWMPENDRYYKFNKIKSNMFRDEYHPLFGCEKGVYEQ